MKQISVFHKGISTDFDYSKLDNNNLLFPCANIQLTNRDGQGLVITPVKGNERAFNITPGFYIIGGCEYNGIAYIVSHNPTTNHSEFGSFPSPKDGGGFQETYKPLQNLQVAGRIGRFTTAVLELSLENSIADQMFALPEYDGSVNLAFTDKVNDLRLINSGFDQEGNYTDIFYNVETLVRSSELIKSLPGKQQIQIISSDSGGRLKFGTYYFFYRYVTESNDRTVFVAESKPYPVIRTIPENRSLNTSGFDENSTQKINIKLENLDASFAYVEFAFIRRYSSESGAVITETKIVDNLYSISSLETIQLSITGFETFTPLSIAEILTPVNNETVCESIVPYDRKLWGVNWKSKEINYQALKEYALKIRLSADDTDVIPSWDARTFYGKPENLYKGGYFRGETYIGGVSFELNNGYETERFPVRGIDAYHLSCQLILQMYGGAGTNENGVIRMPSNNNSPYMRGTAEGWELRILKLVFNMQEASGWLNSNPNNYYVQWIKENVRSVRFVRSDRIPNRLYQGYVFKVAGRGGHGWETNNVSIPYFVDDTSGYIPITEKFKGSTIPFSQEKTYFASVKYPFEHADENTIKAIVSSDYVFKNTFDIQDGDQVFAENGLRLKLEYQGEDDIRPPYIGISIKTILSYSSSVVELTNISNVKDTTNWITPNRAGNLRLVNKVMDLSVNPEDTSNALQWFSDKTRFNRNITMAPYIGIKDELGGVPVNGDRELSVITLLRYRPNTIKITDIYSSELNLQYKKITDEIHEVLSINDNVFCYQGDAFVQLTSIKVRTYDTTREIGNERDEDERKEIGASISAHGFGATQESNNRIKYAHGTLLDLVTENEINSALRIRTVNETTFYPALPERIDVGEDYTLGRRHWAVFPYSTEVKWFDRLIGTGIESYLVNFASSMLLSAKGILSDNPNIPKGKGEYNNRVRYSGEQEPNRPILGYRIWNYNHKRDFDDRYGEMIKVAISFGRLVTVQQSSVMLHYINQEQTVPTETGEMIIGVRSILSAQPRVLARFGAQHTSAVVGAKTGLYGFDWMNLVVWRTAITEEGGIIVRSLDDENLIRSYMKDLKSRMIGDESTTTNIVKQLKSNLFVLDRTKVEGIHAGYDAKNGEIHFTVFKDSKNETLRYSEEINGFIGNFHYPVIFYFNIHKDIYSVPSFNFSDLREYGVFIHGNGRESIFYERFYDPVFSFIINGMSPDGNSLYGIDKHFKAIEIESPEKPMPIKKVQFETMFQKTSNDPFYDEERFWLLPEYLQSKWAAPINVAEQTEDSQFKVESNMVGKWMKMIVTLKPGLPTFVKNIITIFTTSNT